jgi:hypothetical protein
MNRRWIGWGVLAVLLGLLFFIGKVSYSSRSEYQQGEEAWARGDWKKAIRHYDRAIHWYTPFSSTVPKSIQRLWEIGQQREQEGDERAALEAYWSLRSGLYGARSFYVPQAEWIERANERIAALWAAREPYAEEEKTMSPAERQRDYLQLLQKDRAPKVGWAAVTEIGFFGWVGSVLMFIFTFLRKEGGLARGKALLWGGSTAFFYFLWILGMVRA